MATKKVKKPYQVTAFVNINAEDGSGTTIDRELVLKFSSLSQLFVFIEDMEAESEDN